MYKSLLFKKKVGFVKFVYVTKEMQANIVNAKRFMDIANTPCIFPPRYLYSSKLVNLNGGTK